MMMGGLIARPLHYRNPSLIFQGNCLDGSGNRKRPISEEAKGTARSRLCKLCTTVTLP